MDRICCDCGAHFEGVSRDIRCPGCRKTDHAHPLRELTCQQCGNPYTSRSPRSCFCPSCAADRAKAASARFRSNKHKRHIGSEDICESCGSTYIVASGLQRFCPQCAADRKRQRARECYYSSGKVQREQRTESRIIATATCAVCGKPFPLDGSRFVVCSPECAQINWDNLRRRWTKEHAEYIKERMRLWELKHKEQRKTYHKKWHSEHREQRNEQQKAYRKKKKEQKNDD